MAGSVNKVILVGNLGKDPEVRKNQNGGKIVTFSLATSEQWKDRTSGERKEKTEWHRVVVFNDRIADVVERYMKKGAKVYVEGQLQTRKWQGNDGQERYTTEVVIGQFKGELTMLDSRGVGAPAGNYGDSDPGPMGPDDMGGGFGGGSSSSGSGGASRSGGGDLNDEIPF